MKIVIAHNLRTDETESTAELLTQTDIDRLCETFSALKHTPIPVEVSGKPHDVIERILDADPDLIFNVAEGTIGSSREAFYPSLYEQLQIPFSGGNASLLHMNLDKHLSKTVLAAMDIKVPKGILVNRPDQDLPTDLEFPLMIKPNSEGSSKGITQKSVVENAEQARSRIGELLRQYPLGVIVEEFIVGKELSVPYLESFPGKLLSIVEHTFDLNKVGGKYNIYDYEMKQGGEAAKAVQILCPAVLTAEEEKAVYQMARDVFDIMDCPDLGRVDIRLREDGVPFFIELNPLPSLHPDASLMTSARVKVLEYKEVIKLILRSATRRHHIPLRQPKRAVIAEEASTTPRPTARELGIFTGWFQTGVNNAITDVKGVKVGHLTLFEDQVQFPGVPGTTTLRSGVTAILPSGGAFSKRLVAGGFVLNGVGEMAGLTQVLELGWLESPIILTNSNSVGPAHTGVVNYMTRKYPELAAGEEVVMPVVGEADDSFLNDPVGGVNPARNVIKAIDAAQLGPVLQGSVGAGTGMMSFDFAGGIGTSSRVFKLDEGLFTVGVLVMSNFGRMRNLTIDGQVVGRDLDELYPKEGRREHKEGSVIVVVATDLPLLSSQLNRVSRRAALGLGRTGSYAASSSGEIIIAFSTANRTSRSVSRNSHFINLRCISDNHINLLYEAVIEATEEAVLNAMFCSSGMTGRLGREAPPLPHDRVMEILKKGRNIG